MDKRIRRELWEPYVQDIAAACEERKEDTALIVAIGARETHLGTSPGYLPKGPNGKGDGGHGRGIFQIDDRHEFKAFIPPDGTDWPVIVQARCACHVLATAREELAEFSKHPLFERAVICRYNSSRVKRAMSIGVDPDLVTTRGPTGKPDYGTDVLFLRDSLRRFYPERFPPFTRR